MPKLLTAVLAVLVVLAVAAMVQATSLVPPPPPSTIDDAIDRVEKVRDREREVWERVEKSMLNWRDLARERFRRIAPEPPLPPFPPIRPPPIVPLR